MALGNYTPFLPRHVTGIQFGDTAWAETDLTSTSVSLDASFAVNNASPLIDLAGAADTVNPTVSHAFAKEINQSGNERTASSEALLGSLDGTTQNTEKMVDANSLLVVECTVVYKNPKTTAIFNDSTKACLMTLDNEESSTTGALNIALNNITVEHVGGLTRGNSGLMEQKIKFSCRGGLAGSAITCVDTPVTYLRYRLGLDYAEEIQTA